MKLYYDMLCAVSKELKDSNLSCRREENVFAVQWTVSQFSLLLEIRVAFFNNISSCLGTRLQHPWWKRCLRNTRAALKQVRIRNSGHILARRAAAGLKASRCALYPLLALHSFTSDNNARGFCECIIVGHCTHN